MKKLIKNTENRFNSAKAFSSSSGCSDCDTCTCSCPLWKVKIQQNARIKTVGKYNAKSLKT